MNIRFALAAVLGAFGALLGAGVGAGACMALALPSWAALAGFGAGGLGGAMLAVVAAVGVFRLPPPPAPPPRVSLEPIVAALVAMGRGRVSASDATDPVTIAVTLKRLAAELEADRNVADMRSAMQRTELTKQGAELIASKAQAVEANQARDAFLSRMSHELRTPLNAILGYLELVEECVEDELLREDLRRVRSAALNLLGIVTTVLDLTQLQSGAVEIHPEALDLPAMIQTVVDGLASDAQTNGNTLTVSAPSSLAVRLDRRMLHAILFNLCSNGCKYTFRGTVTVELKAAPADRISLVVTDSGIGMTKRQIDEAFRPFAQADESVTRRYDGAGLGLAVVRGFVEAMGGRLAIESTLGKGAQVRIDLPRTCRPRAPKVLQEDEPTMLVR